MKSFKTRKEANTELKKRNAIHDNQVNVYKWTHTKRQKPFYVGDEMEWLNLD